jgi:AcrR family transcriptional regulator
VVRTALGILEAEGENALTMRRLARELGVAPMSVYWHVGDREELLDALVGEVLGGLVVDVPAEGPWAERMSIALAALRAQLLAHPQVVPLLARRRRLAPAIISAGVGVLELAVELGLDDAATVDVFRAVMWHTVGSLFMEGYLHDRGLLTGPSTTQAVLDRALQSADVDDVTIRRLEPELTRLDADDLFRYGTARLLEGIERDAAARAASTSRSTTRQAAIRTRA